jgi:AcrR family transcriptional regulator
VRAFASRVRATPPIQERLLDAAREELADRCWAEISMDQVARRAGIGRTRLYEEFGSREEFEHALIAREVATLLAGVEQALNENRQAPARALAVASEAFLTSSEERPLLANLASQEIQQDDRPLGERITAVDAAVSRLSELIVHAWPSMRRVEAKLISEALVRLAISHLLWPSATKPADRGSVAEVFGPYLEKAVGVEEREPLGPAAEPRDGAQRKVADIRGSSSPAALPPVTNGP